MNNKVAMIEYQGRVDEKGKALGHCPKVFNEYFDFIKDYCQVSVFAPKEILNEFHGTKECVSAKILPGKIVMGQDKTILAKISNKINMFKNIGLALKHTDADTVWFFNVEYYLFLYLFLHRKINKKIVCTMFLDCYRGGIPAKIKQFIFEKAQKKIDLIISTGKQLHFNNCKYEFVPDYFYDKKLDRYNEIHKEKLAVSLGTMRRDKQLKEMILAFNKMDYPLIVAGSFHDKALYKELCEIASSNVTIRDEYLSEDEYLKLLAKATYSVLPYNPEKYDRQTSGVMQETIFVNTIPVTYNAILNGNGIEGIGFDNWDELNLIDYSEDTIDEYHNKYQELISDIFSETKVKEFYKRIFE